MKIMIVTENRGVEDTFIHIEKKELNVPCRTLTQTGGIKNMQAYPTMLMKTKENESDKWAYPTMLMKTKGVNF